MQQLSNLSSEKIDLIYIIFYTFYTLSVLYIGLGDAYINACIKNIFILRNRKRRKTR